MSNHFIDKENLSPSKWEVSFFSKPLKILEALKLKSVIKNTSEIQIDRSAIIQELKKENEIGYISNDLTDNSELVNNIKYLSDLFLKEISLMLNHENENNDDLIKLQKENLNDILLNELNYNQLNLVYKYLKPIAITQIINNLKGTENYNLFNYYKEILEKVLFYINNNVIEQLQPQNFQSPKKEEEDDEKEPAEDEEGEGDEKKDYEEDKESDSKKEVKTEGNQNPPKIKVKSKNVCDLTNREIIYYNVKKKTSDFRLTSKENTASKKLAEKLDISFNPKSDIIHSLKMGKLDTNKISEVSSGNFNIYKREEEEMDTKPFSVCILCDESGSMQEDNKLIIQNSVVKTIYSAFKESLPANKIFVYGHTSCRNNLDRIEEFSRHQGHSQFIEEVDGRSCLIRVYNEPGYQNFDKTINNQLNQFTNSNLDSIAIEQVYYRVRSFTTEPILFIGLSDGEPAGQNYGGYLAEQEMKRVMQMAKRDNYVTVGIGINSHSVEGIYEYTTVVYDLDELPKKVSRILNDVVKKEFQDF